MYQLNVYMYINEQKKTLHTLELALIFALEMELEICLPDNNARSLVLLARLEYQHTSAYVSIRQHTICLPDNNARSLVLRARLEYARLESYR